jgi:hypothetical protein
MQNRIFAMTGATGELGSLAKGPALESISDARNRWKGRLPRPLKAERRCQGGRRLCV